MTNTTAPTQSTAPPPSTAPPTPGRQTPWWVATLLFFFGWVFMYADRTILNPVQSTIAQEYGLNNAEVGLISSAFFLVYALTQIPSGVLGDKFGRVRFIVFGFIVFGLFTGLTGLAGGLGILLLYRAMAGFGQGFYYGPQFSLSGDLIPTKHRTLGSAIINSGQAFGISLGLIASSYISFDLGLGWKAPFYVFAIPTILVGVGIWFFIRDPRQGSSQVAANQPKPPSIRSLFRIRNLVLTFVIVFCSIYGFFVMVTWLPTYLEVARDIPRASTGYVASLIAFTSVPTSLVFAHFSDRIGRRRPLLLIVIPLAIISILTLILAPQDNFAILIVALVLYGMFGKLATDPLLIALVGVNTPSSISATAFSTFNFIGMSSAIIAPYFTGWLVDATGSFNAGFFVAVGLLVIGLIAALMLRENKDLAK